MSHPTGKGKEGDRNVASIKIPGEKDPGVIRNQRLLPPLLSVSAVTAPPVAHYISSR